MSENEDPIILIEFLEDGVQKASLEENFAKLKEESQRAMNLAMGTIQIMANRLTKTIRELEQEAMPDEIEVEFGLKLELDGGTVVPMVAKTTVGGQFTVKFKWSIERPQEARTLIKPNP